MVYRSIVVGFERVLYINPTTAENVPSMSHA